MCKTRHGSAQGGLRPTAGLPSWLSPSTPTRKPGCAATMASNTPGLEASRTPVEPPGGAAALAPHQHEGTRGIRARQTWASGTAQTQEQSRQGRIALDEGSNRLCRGPQDAAVSGGESKGLHKPQPCRPPTQTVSLGKHANGSNCHKHGVCMPGALVCSRCQVLHWTL